MSGTKRQPRNRALFIVAALFVAVSSTHGRSPASEKWLHASTGDVRVFSNASETRTVEVTRQLAQFRRVLARVLGNTMGTLPDARVVLLKNHASYDRYGRRDTERAYYLRDRFERFIVLNATPIASTRARASSMQENPYTFFPYQDMYHGLFHHLFDRSLAPRPAWLDEGLAEYYSSYTTKRGQAIIGLPYESRVQFLRSWAWLPPDDLLDGGTVARRPPLLIDMFYAQSWAVVHYLASGTNERQRELSAYVAQVRRGVPHDIAFAESFTIDAATLMKETHEYIDAGKTSYVSVDLTDDERSIDVRVEKLPPQDALCVVGRLMIAASSDRVDEAERLFRAALSIDEISSAAYLGLALADEARDEPARAGESYRRASELSPDDHELILRYGFNRLRTLTDETDPEKQRSMIADARSLFRRATETDPKDALGSLGLARSYLYDEEVADEAHSALLTARGLLPDDGEAPVLATAFHLRDGAEDLAEALVLAALRSYPFPFLTALRREVSEAALSLADDQRSWHKELSRIFGMLQAVARQDRAPTLANGIGWERMELELAALANHLRLFDVAQAIRVGEPERARHVLDEIADGINASDTAAVALSLATRIDAAPQAEESIGP